MRVRRVLVVLAVTVWAVMPVPVSGEDSSGEETVAALCDPGSVSQFTDVVTGEYGADYILCVRALGLSAGTAGGAYGPESELTRAQMATFLVRLWQDVLGRDCPESMGVPFVDVAGNTHEGAIGCLYGLGVTVGTTAVTYDPDGTVTGSQISRFLARVYEKAGNSCGFEGEELDRAVDCLAASKVIPSEAEGTSTGSATRDQMAVYLIGLWHNLAGRGLPPAPPHKPANRMADVAQTVAVTRRSLEDDGEYDDEDDEDDDNPNAGTTTRTTVPDNTPYTDNDGTDSDGYDTPDGSSTVGTQTTTGTTGPTSASTGTTAVPDNTPYTDNDETESDGYDTPDGSTTVGTRTTTGTTGPTSASTGTTAVPDNTPYTDNDGTDSDGYDTPDGSTTVGTQTTTGTTGPTSTSTGSTVGTQATTATTVSASTTTGPTSTSTGTTVPDYSDSADSDSD